MSKVNNETVLDLVIHLPPLAESSKRRKDHEESVRDFFKKHNAPLSKTERRKLDKAKRNARFNSKKSVPLHRMAELKAALRR
jgi:hypothetical protein